MPAHARPNIALANSPATNKPHQIRQHREKCGLANSNVEFRDPEVKTVGSSVELPGRKLDSMIFRGRRQPSVATIRSDGGSWDVDRLGFEAENRLTQEKMRVQGRIATLDTHFSAFDRNSHSRTGRDADPRCRPKAFERRMDLERRTLKAQSRQVRRELRRSCYEQRPTST
jgi:hypothetical protein